MLRIDCYRLLFFLVMIEPADIVIQEYLDLSFKYWQVHIMNTIYKYKYRHK